MPGKSPFPKETDLAPAGPSDSFQTIIFHNSYKGDILTMKTITLTLLFFLHLSGFAMASDYTFTLINKTGFEIIDLYFSPASRDVWGDEVLTVDTIPNKEKMKINFSRREKAETWDILVNDEQGVSFTWPGLKLSEISTLVLTIKAGQPMAFYE
jgi:hypothetical protein